MKQELQEMLDECDKQIKEIECMMDSMSTFDKSRNYLTNYLLIKVCGTVELIYRSIVADYFSQFQNTKIDTYLEKTVRKGSNSATYENMKKLLNKFDSAWGEAFKAIVDLTPDKDKLIAASQSLVNNRHLFAHGSSPTATFNDIKSYYYDVLKLIEIFDSIVV